MPGTTNQHFWLANFILSTNLKWLVYLALFEIIFVSGLTGNIKLQSGARSSLEFDLMMFHADTGLVAK